MPKLNFYDTDAVKAFLLNTLVENKEVREDVDFERRQSQTWFTQYRPRRGAPKPLKRRSPPRCPF